MQGVVTRNTLSENSFCEVQQLYRVAVPRKISEGGKEYTGELKCLQSIERFLEYHRLGNFFFLILSQYAFNDMSNVKFLFACCSFWGILL